MLARLLIVAGLIAGVARAQEAPRNLGRVAKWGTLAIAFVGPLSQARGTPNPFSVTLDVTFTAPSGATRVVPGFYDGDGRGGGDGRVWKARFSPEETGRWRYATRSTDAMLDQNTGTFAVTAPPTEAPDLRRWGRLERSETRYLKFRDGPYWLKAGCDDPENFLGRSAPYDTPAKRRAAIDFLAARGVNSLYAMTHNLEGDDNDVWPWLGDTPDEAQRHAGPDARFDIPRLSEWRALFEHMTRRGVVPYLVLEDDSAWDEYDHARYYRELIARFGDLPALLFNFNEEHNENYTLDEALAHMRRLREIDPYDHPRGIHNVNEPSDAYIRSPEVDFTSIQTNFMDATDHHAIAMRWLERCAALGRRNLVINFDEGRPEEDRRGWWSAYLAGAVWETHVLQPYDRPLSAWEPAWTELGGARAFLETLPFWRMTPAQDVIANGRGFCLAEAGQAYALYLPAGGAITITLPEGDYDAAWWDPRNGRVGRFIRRTRLAGGTHALAAPDERDWALRLLRRERRDKP